MESAAGNREPTTGAEKHHLLKVGEYEEDEEQVFNLERKTSLSHNGKRPDSTEGSTITTTTTNSSSSSSFSSDGNEGTAVFRFGEGEHTEVPDESSPEQESEIEFQEEGRGILFLDANGQQPTGDVIEEEDEVETEDAEDYDVEKVLRNQKTHDLYCPKCKIRITERVILKRRQRTPSQVPPKRQKGPHDQFLVHSEDNKTSQDVVGQAPVPQSFLFKCLSCFNIFSSTAPGVGSEPLPLTNESGETLNVQPNPLENPTGNSSWFISIFGFHKHGSDAPKVSGESSHNTSNVGAGVEEEDISPAPMNPKPGNTHLYPFQPSPVMTTGPDGVRKETVGDTSDPTKTEFGQSQVTGTPPNLGTDNLPVRSPGTDLEQPLLRPAVVEGRKVEILKSIVYGGLIESITSLGVISSAAGSGASTLNILVLGLANLFGGLILIIHNLQELREEEPRTEDNEEVESRYKKLLGRRENFAVHATFAILSFIIMGLLPPVVYYLSFRETHNKDYKVASVFGSSLLCIVFLAIAKAHTKTPRGSYLKSVLYYATNAVSVSGITYVAGNVVNQLLEKYGWADGPEGDVMLLSLMGRKAGSFGY